MKRRASRSVAVRPGREETELVLGRGAVLEILRAGRRRVECVLVAEGVRETEVVARIVAMAAERGIPLERARLDELERGGEKSHGIAAEVSPFPYETVEDILGEAGRRGEAPLVVLLDEMQDPQNFGTLLRTAEAAGVHGVIVPYRRTAGVTPAVVRSSAGASEHLRIAAENLARAVERLREAGVTVVALEAHPAAAPLDALDLTRPLGLVVGSEGGGIRRLVRERCDTSAWLPLQGRVGSLNAAVAGSIALYLAWSRRRGSASRGEGIDALRKA